MINATGTPNTEGVWVVTWKFNDDSFDILQEIAEEMRFEPGNTVFNEGDRADGMYLVLEGTALIVRKAVSGDQRVVSTTMPGQSFGEIGLLVERPRQASVIAGSEAPLRVLKITRSVLDLLHKSAPDMAYMMYQMLARSLAEQLLHTSDMQRPR
jgi:CRP-like cAMP-binding protein